MINTTRRYTADEVAELTRLAAESDAIDSDARATMAEVANILAAAGADFAGWQCYVESFAPHLAPLVLALDLDIQTENTSYIPCVGDYHNSKWSVSHWTQITRRARRNLTKLQRAVSAISQEVA